jgi:hypothetical protein
MSPSWKAAAEAQREWVSLTNRQRKAVEILVSYGCPRDRAIELVTQENKGAAEAQIERLKVALREAIGMVDSEWNGHPREWDEALKDD